MVDPKSADPRHGFARHPRTEYPPADQYLSNYEKYLQSEDLAADEVDF